MDHRLFIRPVAWSTINTNHSATKSDILNSIEIFGYTLEGTSIYVRIPRKSTFILKFSQEIDDDIITNIVDVLNPSVISKSEIDPSILIVRANELSPFDLVDNPDFESLSTWIDSQQDPFGEIESLWQTREIGPYEWIMIDKFSPLPGKYTSSDLNIKTEEDHIFPLDDLKLPFIPWKSFLWDLETFSSKIGEFPDSSNPEDFIALVSLFTSDINGVNGYVIIKGDVNSDLVNQRTQNMILIKASDETDLFNKFFALYKTFKPDKQIYHNGDSFDMPYLIERLRINKYEIPSISKINGLKPKVITHTYPTSFGQETNPTMQLPGTEIIDLVHFFRKFYPHLKNHKLDTISKEFIGEGKTGLTIDEMMIAIRTKDVDKLAKVVDYSYVDSLRMYQLLEHNQIQQTLETVCNNLGVSINTLLRLNYEEIIDHAVYNIDPGSCIAKGKYSSPNNLREATKGVYQNVYIYDYSELYRIIMLNSKQYPAAILADRLEGAPPKLILTAFYSSYVDRTELLPTLNAVLSNLLGSGIIIALESYLIRTIGPIESEWLVEVDKAPCYMAVSKASYIILDHMGELETAGLARLCRPKFELAADTIKQYLTLVYSNKLNLFSVPKMQDLPIEKFSMIEKIGDTTSLQPDSIKYKLLLQYGTDITTWVSVKYVMTTLGPVLLSKLKSDDIIDYGYYVTELNKYIKDLQSLKIYGV